MGHKSLNTIQIYLDYFDDDRENDFELDVEKDKEGTIEKIALLGREIETLKLRLNLEK